MTPLCTAEDDLTKWCSRCRHFKPLDNFTKKYKKTCQQCLASKQAKRDAETTKERQTRKEREQMTEALRKMCADINPRGKTNDQLREALKGACEEVKVSV